MFNLADVRSRQGKPEQAEILFRESLAISEATVGHRHVDAAEALARIGECLVAQTRWDEAEEHLDEALVLLDELTAAGDRRRCLALEPLSVLARARGEDERAESLDRRCQARRDLTR